MLNRRGFLASILAVPIIPLIKQTPASAIPTPSIEPTLMPYKGKVLQDAGLYYCPYNPLLQNNQLEFDFMKNGIRDKKLTSVRPNFQTHFRIYHDPFISD